MLVNINCFIPTNPTSFFGYFDYRQLHWHLFFFFFILFSQNTDVLFPCLQRKMADSLFPHHVLKLLGPGGDAIEFFLSHYYHSYYYYIFICFYWGITVLMFENLSSRQQPRNYPTNVGILEENSLEEEIAWNVYTKSNSLLVCIKLISHMFISEKASTSKRKDK